MTAEHFCRTPIGYVITDAGSKLNLYVEGASKKLDQESQGGSSTTRRRSRTLTARPTACVRLPDPARRQTNRRHRRGFDQGCVGWAGLDAETPHGGNGSKQEVYRTALIPARAVALHPYPLTSLRGSLGHVSSTNTSHSTALPCPARARTVFRRRSLRPGRGFAHPAVFLEFFV